MSDTRTPTPEWQRQADAEPYRISVRISFPDARRDRWYVHDMRTDERLAGPFRTREGALARADQLNAEHRAGDR